MANYGDWSDSRSHGCKFISRPTYQFMGSLYWYYYHPWRIKHLKLSDVREQWLMLNNTKSYISYPHDTIILDSPLDSHPTKVLFGVVGLHFCYTRFNETVTYYLMTVLIYTNSGVWTHELYTEDVYPTHLSLFRPLREAITVTSWNFADAIYEKRKYIFSLLQKSFDWIPNLVVWNFKKCCDIPILTVLYLKEPCEDCPFMRFAKNVRLYWYEALWRFTLYTVNWN